MGLVQAGLRCGGREPGFAVTFLPIVVRELQVAARRASTFRVRFWGAVGATLLGGLFLLATSLPGGLAPGGRALFVTLTGVALGAALISGSILTADCLSRERREGTLGLLFLTDLTGWDVVAGKFVALSLVPWQAVLAIFPVTAMSVFLGGVTWGEFWRVLVVILVALFVSLAFGTWVSSRVTDDRHAVWGSLLGTAGWVAGGYVLGAMADQISGQRIGAWLRLAGPAGLYESAMEAGYRGRESGFWWALSLQTLGGMLWFLAASWRVRKGWRLEEIPGTTVSVACVGRGARGWSRLVAGRSDRLRRLGGLAWLGWRGRGMRRVLGWVVCAIVVVASGSFALALSRRPFAGAALAGGVVSAGFWILKALLTAHTAYALHETCRNGTMELLLATPVSSASLWSGHLAAVRALFLWPFVTLSVLGLVLGVGGKLALGGDWPSWAVLWLAGAAPAVLEAVVQGLDLVAIAYYAACWAMRYDRPGKAMLRTLLLAAITPAVLCSHGRFMIDLLILAQAAPELDRFRDLARRCLTEGRRGDSSSARG